MKLTHEEWTLSHLHEHLQAAVDLEFWTIPFYMSAMYSVKDRSTDAYQLIRTILNQEMLHLQCAANIANSYGLSPKIATPVYEGKKVPHLDFALDKPDVIKRYEPYTAEIGVLDEQRINAMCLIEIPDYDTNDKEVSLIGESAQELFSGVREYGSIGAFYRALRRGAFILKDRIKGGVRQVDYFAAFYNNAPNLKITEARSNGFRQVDLLIDLITSQGEGASKREQTISRPFWNTADDIAPAHDHFAKFNTIKGSALPETFSVKSRHEYSDQDKKLEAILIEQFDGLRSLLEGLFSGEEPEQFFPRMASVGGAIRNCWQHGVTPRYSEPRGSSSEGRQS